MGRIIGYKGNNIEGIRKLSETKIKIDREGSKDRVIKVTGPLTNVLCAVENIVIAKESDTMTLGKNILRILLTDGQCKQLVAKGAHFLQHITKLTGVKLVVSPVCLPCSDERVVRVEEGQGNIPAGVREIILSVGSSQTGGGLKPYLPTKTQSRRETKNNDTETGKPFVTGKIPWKDLFPLSKKLGIEIERETPDSGTVNGPKGAIEMFYLILDMKKDIFNKRDEECREQEKEYIYEDDIRTTASALASVCNIPNT